MIARYGCVEFKTLTTGRDIESLCNNVGFFLKDQIEVNYIATEAIKRAATLRNYIDANTRLVKKVLTLLLL